MQAWASSREWLDRLRDWMYVNSHFIDHPRRARLPLPVSATRFYFVRNMFMVAMGLALVGYFALPDRAAAASSRSGASATRWPLHRHATPRTSAVSALFNPFAAVPVDARRVRADGRLAAGAPGQAPRLKVSGSCTPSSSPSWSWPRATTSAWTRSSARVMAGVSAYVAKYVFARARPTVWAFRRVRAGATA